MTLDEAREIVGSRATLMNTDYLGDATMGKDLMLLPRMADGIDKWVTDLHKIKKRWHLFFAEGQVIDAFCRDAGGASDQFIIVVGVGTFVAAQRRLREIMNGRDTIQCGDTIFPAHTAPDLFFCWAYIHELVHIINGHLQFLKRQDPSPEMRKAMEYDADATAIRILQRYLERLIPKPPWGDETFYRELTFFGCYFPMRLMMDIETLEGSPLLHPSAMTRLEYLIEQIAGLGLFTGSTPLRPAKIAAAKLTLANRARGLEKLLQESNPDPDFDVNVLVNRSIHKHGTEYLQVWETFSRCKGAIQQYKLRS